MAKTKRPHAHVKAKHVQKRPMQPDPAPPAGAHGRSQPIGNPTRDIDVRTWALRLFLILGLLIGLSFCFITAPAQVPDEAAHFWRAYAVSEGRLIGKYRNPSPESVVQLGRVFGAIRIFRSPVTWDEFDHWLWKVPLEPDKIQLHENLNCNLYSPAPYLPSALAIGIARQFPISPLILMYFARLANLACFLILVYLAIQRSPAPLLLAAVALMPMTMQQAASASADSASLGVGFLVFAIACQFGIGRRTRALSRAELIAIPLLLVAFGLCKFNVWLLVPLVFARAAAFGGRSKKWRAVILAVSISTAALFIWMGVNSENFKFFREGRAERFIDVARNSKLFLEHPAAFSKSLQTTLDTLGPEHLRQMVGRIGWSRPLPWALGWAYLAAILVLAVSARVRLTMLQRVTLWLASLTGVTSVYVLMFSMEADRELVFQLIQGNKAVMPGVQGRYFIPFAPMFFLGFVVNRIRIPPIYCLALAAAVVVTTATIALSHAWDQYYSVAQYHVAPPYLLRMQ